MKEPKVRYEKGNTQKNEKEIILHKFEVNIDYCPEELCSLELEIEYSMCSAFVVLQPLFSRNTVG